MEETLIEKKLTDIGSKFFSPLTFQADSPVCESFKVIYTKYSKHWPYTVAHTIDCMCRKC